MIDQARIQNTLGKMGYYLNSHDSICVGVSGGSDSNIIVHMIATHFRDYLPKIHFVFENTGLEYRATLNHLNYIEQTYDINIDRIRGESVVSVIKKYGVPVLSKQFSRVVQDAQKGCPWALRKLQWKHGEGHTYVMSKSNKELAAYLIDKKIPVSAKCCDISKKKPYHKYLKDNNCDLTISGERRDEGGMRAIIHHDCFEPSNGKTIDKYMPLFFWNDETKQYYKEHENIRYSDCYEIWGMKRTGCVGCPFNSRVGEDLKMIAKYEPNLYKACMHVFGESYRLMDEFKVHKHKILE